jgi:hypothetical protein
MHMLSAERYINWAPKLPRPNRPVGAFLLVLYAYETYSSEMHSKCLTQNAYSTLSKRAVKVAGNS